MTISKWFGRAAKLCFALMVLACGQTARAGEGADTLRVLFLGDTGHHQPAARFKQLQPVLDKRNIDLTYTEALEDLTAEKLAGFDCLVIYANHTRIAPSQERALLDFVSAGGGFVPLHCASFCFLNSPKYIELVGGQFKSHGTGVFTEKILQPDHPVMKGLKAIESWDESYVHTLHNPNRTVLAERVDGNTSEPYTWVREVGKGRVFYTAWGHDQRTWSNTGFLALVENGIRWASAGSPTKLAARAGLKAFEYMPSPGPLPNYLAGKNWGAQGDLIRTMQKPLEPSESQKHLATFPEFKASLFAAEPDITKPIWMAWDERGRLWVAETVDYPNSMQPLGQGHDDIKICEDTDGDGKADKFTVFADKLSVPTSFVFANGGIIVVHSGKAEFFKDTDGDDKADVRETLFTGWGTGDTHAGPSNLHYGFDNWIWGVVGYSGFRGTVGGKQIQFGQGFYRFKADGSAMEFVRSSNNNTWGMSLTEDNIIIGSTANGNASMYMPIPNRYYEAVNGWSASRLESIADSQQFYPITEKVRQVDWHGKYTAGAGSGIYTARNFPKEYWNRAQFVAEPTGHLLGRFFLERRGADFIAHNARNFVASDDEWTSPIAAEVGPDGALWMIDWYNYIIQHNPTPQGFQNGRGNAYETPLRDKVHGRIYRIAYNDAKPVAPLRLDQSKPEQLVETLKNDNLLWRMHAQRLLVARGKTDVASALCQLAAQTGVDELGLNPAAIHALWTLKGLGLLEGNDEAATKCAADALGHPSAGVRRAAANVLPRNQAGATALLGGKVLTDNDAQVRLAALLALADMPPKDEAGAAIYAVLQSPRNSQDRWLSEAATAAAARNDASFLRAILASFRPAEAKADAESFPNLAPNSSFENERDGKPLGWRTVVHGGKAQFALAETGHSGGRSVKITSETGADASWAATVSVKPRTNYRLTAWVKTEKVSKLGAAHGAMLNIHELQDAVKGATKAIVGDNDWTMLSLNFNSGDLTELTVNCLFGGWGFARGAAWWDDVQLTQTAAGALAGEVGKVVQIVTTHYSQRGPVESIVPTLLSLKRAPASLSTPILDGLVLGWPDGKVPSLGEKDKADLADLMKALPESARDRLLTLAQKWGRSDLFEANIAEITASLRKQITDASLPDDQRIAPAKRLIGLDGKADSVEFLLKQIGLLTTPTLASGLINALSDSRAPETGRAITARWNQLTPTVRRTAITTLMRRTEWADALLDNVEKGSIAPTDLGAEQWSQLKQNPNRAIAGRAGRLSNVKGAISADRQEIVQKLLPLAKQKGDAVRGKEVFTTTCAICHTYNGQGGKIGPDLSGIGGKDRTEILTDILDPNRSVEANYRNWNVTTKGGDTFSGRLETETQTTVEILDTTGMKHVIQRKDIASLEGTQFSIMPAGFEALPENDLKALLEYITQPHP